VQAALLAGLGATLPRSLRAAAQANLPLTVYQLIRSGNRTQLERAYAGAFMLILVVLIAFAAARIISTRGERRLGRR